MLNVKGLRMISRYDSPYYDKARDYNNSKCGKAVQKLKSTVVKGVFEPAKAYMVCPELNLEDYLK